MENNWKTQVFGLEPFEEYQGGSFAVPVSESSQPDAPLTSSHMETRDSPSPTKLSKPRRSLFSRKNGKRTSTSDSIAPQPKSLRSVDQTSLTDRLDDFDQGDTLSRQVSRDSVTATPRSIIPEVLKELPSWYNKEGEWANSTVHQFRTRYPIHNPVGPRHYKNVHLNPHSANNRPSSVFSPAFPPMAADHVDEPGWMPPPSRTPSGSPLPTPDSSQVRIPDGAGKTRSRKPSAVSPQDNVDLLDVSDPWGTNWHHTSPYDGLGLNKEQSPATPVSLEGPDVRPRPRSRMSSLNGGSRHKTTTPSPLSQSTSAVHLQTVPTPEGPPPVTRKMTKSRKPFTSVFGGHAKDGAAPNEATSPPVTPVDATIPPTSPSKHSAKQVGRKPSLLASVGIPKSASTTSIPISTSINSVMPGDKKQKRGSVLVRIARRFSVMRRGTRGHSREPSVDVVDDSHDAGREKQGARPLSIPVRGSSPEKTPAYSRQSMDASKRSPPPPPTESGANPESEPAPASASEKPPVPEPTHRNSIGSLEAPFSIGRLTIANPDTPSSTENSPMVQSMSLPLDGAILGTTASRGRDEKALPIPKFTPDDTPIVESPKQLTPPAASRPGHASPSSPSISSPPPSTQYTFPTHQSQSRTSAPIFNATPSPAIPAPSSYLHPAVTNVVASSSSADDSPLSKASMIVNPPTPYLAPVQIPTHVQIPSPVITPIPSSNARQSSSNQPSSSSEQPQTSNFVQRQSSSRESSPTKREGSRHVKSSSSVKRETETFRLVRSPSAGNVQPSGETIVAQGELWEVVGAAEAKRSKTVKEESKVEKRSKRESKRESRRLEKEREEKEKAEATEQAAFRAAALAAEQASRHSGSSKKSHSHSKEGSSSRKHSSRDSREHRRSADDAGAPSNHTSQRRSIDDAASRPSSRIPTLAPTHERRPSLTNRPTSDIASVAELNAVRAREVWEMDRLFKGRSLAYGLEGPQVVYAQSIGDGSSSGDPRRASTITGGTHGSQHTSYKVSSGFHAHSNNPYGQIPFPGPSGIYSNGTASQTAPAPSYVYPSGFRSYPDISTLPTITSPESSPPRRSNTNPLPEPPRQSPYKPPPMPASIAQLDNTSSAEYWAKFAGVVASTH